jgi:hypothetical protein
MTKDPGMLKTFNKPPVVAFNLRRMLCHAKLPKGNYSGDPKYGLIRILDGPF